MSTVGKRKRMDSSSGGTKEKGDPAFLLGSLLTTEIGSCILPFLDFHDLISLRVTNKSLHKSVSEQQLFSRSMVGLPAKVLLVNPDFGITINARTGWSQKHIHANAVVQSALDVVHKFGKSEESRGILYEEGMALKLLEAGRPVSMCDFQQAEEAAEDDDDLDDMGNYLNWQVSAPEIHNRIKGYAAWKVFKNHHYFGLDLTADSVAFSRVLFGLLINARSIRSNSFKSLWETSGMGGKSLTAVLLIETTDKQKFEIEMDHDMDWEL